MFAVLEEWPRDDTEGLGAVWERLAILLETHAEAEELHFYPELLALGTGGADADSVDEEVEDAIDDHNSIRDGIRAAAKAKVGSEEWWTAVVDTNVANSKHMGEEERQDLADLRQQASLDLRHELAVKFLRFMALKAATGIAPKDKDPQEYIEDHQDTKVTKGDRAPGPATDSLTASDDA